MVAALVLPLRPGIMGPAEPGAAEHGAPEHGGPEHGAPEHSRDAPAGLPRGRLVELAAAPDGARSSAAVQILLASQREGDPVAWIQPRGGDLYPPDLHAAGLDLEALLVVHVPERAGSAGIPKATELVLRTGAFGAVVVDVSAAAVPRGDAWLGRLASLSRERDCRCVLLGPSADRSLGPLVSVRMRPRRRRVHPGRHVLEAEVLKDKSGARPSLPGPRAWVGPEGMP